MLRRIALTVVAIAAVVGFVPIATASASPVVQSTITQSVPWQFAGQDSDCVKVRETGGEVCAHLAANVGKGRNLTAKLSPRFPVGTTVYRQLLIYDVNRKQYLWNDTPRNGCTITGPNSCRLIFEGKGCQRGVYNVTGFVWLPNRDWALKTTVTVVVR